MKSTQDLLDRLTWLEKKHAIAEERIGWWMTERVNREDQIADVRKDLLARGIVDTVGKGVTR